MWVPQLSGHESPQRNRPDTKLAYEGPFGAMLGHFELKNYSKNVLCFNLDARSVPDALVNSFRLLTQLRTRLNPPEHQTPSPPKKRLNVDPGPK